MKSATVPSDNANRHACEHHPPTSALFATGEPAPSPELPSQGNPLPPVISGLHAADKQSSCHKPTHRNPHNKPSYEKKRARTGYTEHHAAESARRRHEVKAWVRNQGGLWGALHGPDYERARHAHRVFGIDHDGNVVLSHCWNGFTSHKPDGHRTNIEETMSKEELDEEGFWGLEWDGRLTYVFLDIHDTIIIVTVGAPAEEMDRPPEKCWSDFMKKVTKLLESQRAAHEGNFEREWQG
ncbi:unnamed protein product [Peniophora sp. CBMAI 1063]|nr:unnamed protein product [Peniophora sp. CBMAI 1063]